MSTRIDFTKYFHHVLDEHLISPANILYVWNKFAEKHLNRPKIHLIGDADDFFSHEDPIAMLYKSPQEL